MAAPVVAADLAVGAEWPPERLRERIRRTELLHTAARGNLAPLLSDTGTDITAQIDPDQMPRIVGCNRIGAVIDAVNALLLTTDPGAGMDPTMRQAIQCGLEQAATDAMTYGRGLLAVKAQMMVPLDMRYAYPLDAGDSGMWVTVEPMVTVESPDGQPDKAIVEVFDGSTAMAEVREYEFTHWGPSTLGDTVATLPAVPARVATADRPPMHGRWGTSAVLDMLPIAVELERRDAGLSRVLDRNEAPVFVVVSNTGDLADIAGTLNASGTGETATPTPAELRRFAPSLRDHDVLIAPTGVTDVKYVTWDGDMMATFEFMNRLDQEWTRVTGMAPIESADTGDTPSGVALARRNAMLTARTARLHSALHVAAMQVLGMSFDWPYIGTQMVADMAADGADTFTNPDDTEGGDDA